MNVASNSCLAWPEAGAEAVARPLDALFAAVDAWFAAATADARAGRQAPQAGVVAEMHLADDARQRYFLYVPRGDSAGRRIFVAIHGISRNAEEHAREFSRLADRHGLVVVAPLFDEERFPDYQRLGRSGKGERADLMLDRIVAEAARICGADARRLHMFGYSGGGQFVHRYAMAHPERVAAYAIGAAGWYTLPDPVQKYPLGVGATTRLPDLRFDPERFLAVPAAVFVGDRDIHDGTALRQNERLRAEQGENRYERGLTWITAMANAARSRALDTEFHFESLPRSPHSFEKSMRRGGLGERVLTWMFERAIKPAAGDGRSGEPPASAAPGVRAVSAAAWPAAHRAPIGAETHAGIRAIFGPAAGIAQAPADDRRTAADRDVRTCAAGPP